MAQGDRVGGCMCSDAEACPLHSPNAGRDTVVTGTAPPLVDIVADVRERPSDTFTVLSARSDVALTIARLRHDGHLVDEACR